METFMNMEPIYFVHIVKNLNDPKEQFTFSSCINDFMETNIGHFSSGKFIHDEWDGDLVYYREQLLAGYCPPLLLVDLVMWMQDKKMWADWMGDFDRILVTKKYLDGM